MRIELPKVMAPLNAISIDNIPMITWAHNVAGVTMGKISFDLRLPLLVEDFC